MDKNLAWFIGPKAENSDVFSELIKQIILDYFHWRKNYFPDDPLLINMKDKREFEIENDLLYQNLHEFLASLRRNFPFYNPRYIAHMLSDVSMPSLLGYFAAMLYNANNVTPEAAPVTTEWEIEVSNDILKMLGFKPSPIPPSKNSKVDEWRKYQKELQNEFGWAHITSGGTVANIEALWVARNIKYFPLAIQEVSIQENLDIIVKLPNGKEKDIKNIDKFTLINIKPNESIYLLSKYIKAYTSKYSELDFTIASENANKKLQNAECSPSKSIGKLLSEFPLAIFVSGTAHYSVKKAADILGIGRDNIKIIDIDASFRADMKDLKRKIKRNYLKKTSPLAVIGVVGTTEEGAIDPIDKIIDIRKEFEQKSNFSFWLHIDAAWGGYARTILHMEEQKELEIIEDKICAKLSQYHNKSFNSIYDYKVFCKEHINKEISSLETKIERNILALDTNRDISDIYNEYSNLKKEYFKLSKTNEDPIPIKTEIDRIRPIALDKEELDRYINILDNLKNNYNEYVESRKKNSINTSLRDIEKFLNESEYILFNNGKITDDVIKLNVEDRIKDLANYSSDKIVIQYKKYSKNKFINIGNGKNFIHSYLAFNKANSITTDPHKLGYIQYPNGIVSFKNDRIRHFIIEDAPYITSSSHSALLHSPPMHMNEIDFNKLKENKLPYADYKISIDAFAPFILEGSKPGAAAASLWLSNKTIPLTRNGLGTIIKNSLLATRELYEWLISWKKIMEINEEDISYDFLPISSIYPDLNVIVFSIKAKNISSITCMNRFVKMVYDEYSIQAELGDKKHSYSQPFFLTKTPLKSPNYSYSALKDFFNRNHIRHSKKEYEKEGILVLRATLMNPYIYPYKKEKKMNFIKEFILDLHKTSSKVAPEIITKHSRQQCI